MLGKAIMNLHRALLLAALTVALVATGFAHRMPSTGERAGDQALALALAYGASLKDLCADGKAGDQHQGPGCLACQIAGTADLPPVPGDLQKLELVFLATVTAPRESRAALRVLDLSNAPQGPPTV